MKVLRIINTMNPEYGGPCQGIRNIVPEMKKMGVHTEVVSLDDPDAYFLSIDDFTIHALGKGEGLWSYNSNLMPWLEKHLAEFDAVIVHGLWLYPNYATHKVWKKLKRKNAVCPKLYIMPHGMLDPWFQRAKGRKLKAIRNWFYWKFIEQFIVNDADGILFTCEEEKILARTTFSPYHPKSEINIGYGVISPPDFNQKMSEVFFKLCPEVEQHSYFLFLGRINVKKGIDLLINAYLEIKKTGKQLPKLVIAGPGIESPYGKKIREMAGADKDIIVMGMLMGDAKWGAFYNCQAFLLPSHQENFGIAVVEALSCNKPVMISNKVNIWREIESEGAGIVSPDTIGGVKTQLERWISLSIEEIQIMSVQAGKVAKKYFSVTEASIRRKLVLEK